MTLSEYKAFKEGYLAARRGKLTDKDYKLLWAKLDEVQPGSCSCWHCRSPWITYSGTARSVDLSPTVTWASNHTSGSTITLEELAGN